MTDAVDLIQKATDYARKNLAECAADILASRLARDQYPAGKCAFVRAMLAPIYGPYDRESETIVERLALEHAAQGWRALAEVQPEPGKWVVVGWYLRGSGEWCTGTDIAPIGKPYTHWHPLPPPPVKP